MNRKIKIVPLNDPPNFILNEIKGNYEKIFNFPVLIGKNIKIPDNFRNSSKNQYRRTSLRACTGRCREP